VAQASAEVAVAAIDFRLSTALMTAAMALPWMAQAESAPDRGLISLRYLDYLDSQPDADRIRVKTSALKIMAPVAGVWALGATLTNDGISGASPAHHTTALGKLTDHRRAFDADATRFLPAGSVTVGASNSNESDYRSRGVSIQGSHSGEDKNTTWTLGTSYTSDEINPTNHVVRDESKQVSEFLLGLTQVMTMRDIVQLNLGVTRGRGYYSDPYKIFDNRPRERNSATILARWNHQFEATDGTLRSSYRYFSDSWNIRAHTLVFEYVQPLSDGWSLTPALRLYSQSAADFYVNAGPPDSPFAPNPPGGAIHFSEDQRMSAYGARTVGLKIAKQIDEDWQADLKVEQYVQKASWRLFGDGSPGLAQFNARSIQLAVARQF
jgi:hypothetical protein